MEKAKVLGIRQSRAQVSALMFKNQLCNLKLFHLSEPQSYNCKVEMLPIELVVFSLSLTNTYGTLNQSGKETAFYVF